MIIIDKKKSVSANVMVKKYLFIIEEKKMVIGRGSIGTQGAFEYHNQTECQGGRSGFARPGFHAYLYQNNVTREGYYYAKSEISR